MYDRTLVAYAASVLPEGIFSLVAKSAGQMLETFA